MYVIPSRVNSDADGALGIYRPVVWNWRRSVDHFFAIQTLCQDSFKLTGGQRIGEGGSFALYQGLYPRKELDVDADRTLTGDTFFHEPVSAKQTFKEKARWPLLFWVFDIQFQFLSLKADRLGS